ncbi:hypothetical protein NMY22_g1910 [Coprinellus aureogranulatus]|nr:hypothetical protein NMY22_g1910 [Coprinellus aureogranulatus]
MAVDGADSLGDYFAHTSALYSDVYTPPWYGTGDHQEKYMKLLRAGAKDACPRASISRCRRRAVCFEWQPFMDFLRPGALDVDIQGQSSYSLRLQISIDVELKDTIDEMGALRVHPRFFRLGDFASERDGQPPRLEDNWGWCQSPAGIRLRPHISASSLHASLTPPDELTHLLPWRFGELDRFGAEMANDNDGPPWILRAPSLHIQENQPMRELTAEEIQNYVDHPEIALGKTFKVAGGVKLPSDDEFGFGDEEEEDGIFKVHYLSLLLLLSSASTTNLKPASVMPTPAAEREANLEASGRGPPLVPRADRLHSRKPPSSTSARDERGKPATSMPSSAHVQDGRRDIVNHPVSLKPHPLPAGHLLPPPSYTGHLYLHSAATTTTNPEPNARTAARRVFVLPYLTFTSTQLLLLVRIAFLPAGMAMSIGQSFM